MFFKSLKTFLWNRGKSITRWIRASWGADCCRQLHLRTSVCKLACAIGKNCVCVGGGSFLRSLAYSLASEMIQNTNSPRRWMSELQASDKPAPLSLCAVTLGRKTHLWNSLKCEVKLQTLLPHHSPLPSRLRQGGLLGAVSEMKSDASSVKEGCAKPGDISQQLGCWPGSLRGVWQQVEGLPIYSSCHSPSVTPRWENSSEERQVAQREPWSGQ